MAMTEQADDEQVETNHPAELSLAWFNINRADKIAGLVMLIGLLVVLLLFGKLGALIAAALIYVLARRNTNGRTYYVIGQALYSVLWIWLVLRDELWSGTPNGNWLVRWLRRSSPLLLDLEILRDPDNPDDEIGLIYSPTENNNSIVLFGDGSDIASVGLRQQFERTQAHADGTKRLASSPGLDVGVSYVFRRRPPNVEKQIDWDTGNSQGNVLLPEALLKEDEDRTARDKRNMFLLGETGETWQMVGERTNNVDMATVLTITRTGALEAAAQGKSLRSGREIERLPIIKLARTAVAGLERARVDNPTVANPLEIEGYLRRSWDVATIGSYDVERSQDPEDVDLTKCVRHWPRREDSSIVVKHDHCIIDGTIHGVIRVTGLSQLAQNPVPNWLRQIFMADVRYLSVALVGETLNYRGEYWWLEKAIPLRSEFLYNVLGRTDPGPRSQDKQQSLETRREEIYRSIFLQDYVVLIVVSNTDMEAFEDDVAELIRHAESTIGLNVERVKGRVRQIPYFLSATTGIAVKL